MSHDGAPARRVRIRMDLRPLRHSRDFRWVFISGLVTYLGSMVTMVALPFQVADLTGSFVAVGLIGLAEPFRSSCSASGVGPWPTPSTGAAS